MKPKPLKEIDGPRRMPTLYVRIIKVLHFFAQGCNKHGEHIKRIVDLFVYIHMRTEVMQATLKL